MSMTILRRRERESFEVPLLPVRRTGLDLRESLARFCPPVAIRLGPGERIIGGRVFYSAAWLDAPNLPDLHNFKFEKEDIMIYDVRIAFDFETEEEHLGPEFAANVIAGAVREALDRAAITNIQHGIGCRVTPRGASVNAPTEEVAAS
jgi:hypothetical protein